MERIDFNKKISDAFGINPAVALLGPRQCGKTTLARSYIEQKEGFEPDRYFDLKRNSDINRLKNPELTLSRLTGLIVIDEIQRVPALFPTIRVLVDEPSLDQQYLILGCASRDLIQQSSESLAGRLSYIELTPFNAKETKEAEKLWLRGGFPKSYLSETDEKSFDWREDYIRTYLEQDIPALGITVSPANLNRFWQMLAHYHGNNFNASELGRSLGLSHNTMRHYADILASTFMIRQLQPWYANIKKRHIKSPKIYFRDSGILHALLGIRDQSMLHRHPKLGASWEGFAMEEIIRHHSARENECYFWGIHNQAELDLIIVKEGLRLGFEFKYSDAPKYTRSIEAAETMLELDSLTIIYPGKHSYPLSKQVSVMSLEQYLFQCYDSASYN